VLTSEQIERYAIDGFLAIEGFAGAGECSALADRASQIVEEWEPSTARSVFTTDEQTRHSDREFFDSASRIWCFFEERALDADGNLLVDKASSINKIGHAQHDLDGVFREFSYAPRLAEVADAVGMTDPRALQSMYIFKQPYIGGEVGCHQDAAFLYTDPITVIGFWFAIEDATIENGCLWAAPGGHRGPLRQRFMRDDLDDPARSQGTVFEALDHTPLPEPPPKGGTLVPLEVPRGTLVVLNGLLPHWSDVNRSGKSRHAYTLHCISGAAQYPDWNWLQRPADMPFHPLGSVPA